MIQEASGRDLLHRFWLAALVTCVAIGTGSWWLLETLEANRHRNEVALTFSHLAEAFPRLELATIQFAEFGRPQDRETLRLTWNAALYHFNELDTAMMSSATARPDALSIRDIARTMGVEVPRAWRPMHDHDLGTARLPESLMALWESELAGTRVADAMAEMLVLLEPVAHGTGPLSAGEHTLIVQVRRAHDRYAISQALQRGSVLMITEFADTGRTMRVTLALAAAGAIAAVLSVTAVMLSPLASRVEADHRALTGALERARAADKAKAEFLATMSHELRTPLNGILGMAVLLGTSRLDTRQATCVDTIRGLTGGLAGVIDDILEYSRLDTNRLRLERMPFATEDLGRGPAERISAAAALKGIEVMVHTDPAAPARLVGDMARLDHVIANLLSNAVKFTPSGQIVLEIGATRLDDGTAMLRVTVCDTGPGVAPEDAERIFGLFQQGDQSATRTANGVGLGLAICRTLVALMGGRIGVMPNPEGAGACFWVEVALAMADDEDAITPLPSLQGRRVALVSPVAGRRARLAHRLRAAGLRVTPGADSGILWDDPDAPAFDAVIIDHMPPGHDAGPVLEQLAELAPDTGIVVLSAGNAALPDGCATVISKVASPRSVAAALVRAVESHDARIAARATGTPAALRA